MPDLTKCIDCGFLAVRDLHNGKIIEAYKEARETGKIIQSHGAKSSCQFICFEGIRVFSSGEKALAQIQDDVECGEFSHYKPGRSPEGHAAMNIREQVRLETQTHQDQMRLEFEKIRLELEKTRLEITTERLAAAKERIADRVWNLLFALIGSGALIFLLQYYVFNS